MRLDDRFGLKAVAISAGFFLLSVSTASAQWIQAPRVSAPGFQGFGLGYHLGYGYGGHALGVGPNGGYPLYGGPGYPHPDPRVMFRHVGPLTPNPSVVVEGNNRFGRDDVMWYGRFTGAVPYPETFFAPYAGEKPRAEPPLRRPLPDDESR